jgi:hypothetical protein
MKFLFCPDCQDVVRLIETERYCQCGKIHGRYVNKLNAEFTGNATVLGFDNLSLARALHAQRHFGDLQIRKGRVFEAFIVPISARSVTKRKEQAQVIEIAEISAEFKSAIANKLKEIKVRLEDDSRS